ncbi:isatin hydrolase-like isoform X2 [Oratosquilla oratoria]|uniref:isatin hydrolase-like isoform X2 n=1 Tax=Oratosquilla oratoria TaxID=337810 RepID=UPI003F76D4BF
MSCVWAGRMTSCRWFAAVVTLSLVAWLDTCTASRLMELSYTFNVDSPSSPKLRPFEHVVMKKGMNKFGHWVELNDFCASEHSGTHVDAPIHTNKDGWPLERIPLNRLFRVPGVVIDVSDVIGSTSNYEIKVKDLERWDTEHGPIPEGAVVLIRTGWGLKVTTPRRYSGIDKHNKLNFPGLSEEAAGWLESYGRVNKKGRGIVGVGIDTMSLDIGQSVRFPAHRRLSQSNVYGIENVANTHLLPPTGFLLTILPVRIGGGSGAPARIVAEILTKEELNSASAGLSTSASPILLPTFLMLLLLFSPGL